MSKLKIGITGQAGFVGTHLYNTLSLYPEKYIQIYFEDDFFKSEKKLHDFVKECDTIVHLAAMNRHNDTDVIYQTNLGLVKQLIRACEDTQSTPHILFSSSTQEELDNLYGKSKREGRELFEQWALRTGARFTGLVIPNVFGPFGHPYYNSVVATFCHQLAKDEKPQIQIDSKIKLIYVGELIAEIITQIEAPNIKDKLSVIRYSVPDTSEIKVSKLLEKLNEYKKCYYEKGIVPNLDNPFERNLFNTFLCYIDLERFFPYKLKINSDDRGSFIEIVKLNSGGQVSFSTTVPGITRGNHFHTRKAERFAVIKGKAKIELRKIGTNKVFSFIMDGSQPSFVDMPVWYTHNITNTGNEDLYTVFWINEHFNPEDGDTYFEKV